jgi:hypothetical protein
MSAATNWLACQFTKVEIKELKTKSRKAKDPITRAWYAALLEGMKESPWYSDDNAPSLYRDRCMRTAAIAVVAIAKGHELTMDGLHLLQHFRRQLPNTFATLPAVVRDWEAQFSLRIAVGSPGELELRMPEEGAELDGLNEWTTRRATAARRARMPPEPPQVQTRSGSGRCPARPDS